ncbi:MAG TPA: hypothetical protein VGF16_02380 [Bryobacteraceae bacterium]
MPPGVPVPPVVSGQGGPKYLVQPGVTGFVAGSDGAFVTSILTLMNAPGMLSHMRIAARESSRAFSWDRVFEDVYAGYRLCVKTRRYPVAEPAFSVSS